LAPIPSIKDAQRITNIQQQVLGERQARFVVVFFANRRYRAELQAGVAVGFLRSHAGADILFSLSRYVRFHFFPEPFVAAAAGGEVEKARK
jgi:hypothetical protein